MAKNAQLNVRVDGDVKEAAEAVLDGLGMSMSCAVGMFLKEVAGTGRVPLPSSGTSGWRPDGEPGPALAFGDPVSDPMDLDELARWGLPMDATKEWLRAAAPGHRDALRRAAATECLTAASRAVALIDAEHVTGPAEDDEAAFMGIEAVCGACARLLVRPAASEADRDVDDGARAVVSEVAARLKDADTPLMAFDVERAFDQVASELERGDGPILVATAAYAGCGLFHAPALRAKALAKAAWSLGVPVA